jgi:hypothetical protein
MEVVEFYWDLGVSFAPFLSVKGLSVLELSLDAIQREFQLAS